MPDLTRSRDMFVRAKGFTTGGVNSVFRYREPNPIYFQSGNGSVLVDVDGNKYLDFLVANGACILGHGDKKVIEAVKAQLESGLTVAVESELSLDVAGLMHSMIPSAESVKLSNSGTEAVMHAFQICRGYTKKSKIIKTEGCYHGWHDEANLGVHPKSSTADVSNVPVPESQGLAPNAPDNVLVIPYNDAPALNAILRENKDVAAFVIEPVMYNSGCVMPEDGYLQEVREVTQKYGVPLIFDEVITGFRLAPGGAQQYFDVKPDVSVFGKAIANGFPLSAVVGTSEIMSVTEPVSGSVSFAGTYNGNQPSLAAARACLGELRSGDIQTKLNGYSEWLENEFALVAEECHVKARCQSIGGQFQLYFTDAQVTNYREAANADRLKYRRVCDDLFEAGILFSQSFLFHHGTSAAHSIADLERLMESVRSSLRRSK